MGLLPTITLSRTTSTSASLLDSSMEIHDSSPPLQLLESLFARSSCTVLIYGATVVIRDRTRASVYPADLRAAHWH